MNIFRRTRVTLPSGQVVTPRSIQIDQQPAAPLVPDYVGEITAWRAWLVWSETFHSNGILGLSLLSLNGCPWPPKDWLRAGCANGHDHDAPTEECSCGIYAARDLGHLAELGYVRLRVSAPDRANVPVAIGEVGLAGKVIRGTRGWRAERARPKRLFLPHDAWPLARPISHFYRVPVELENTLSKELTHGHRH